MVLVDQVRENVAFRDRKTSVVFIPSQGRFPELYTNPWTKLFLEAVCGFFGSGCGAVVSAVHQGGENGIGNQNDKSKQFCPKLCLIAPILLSLAGYLIAAWSWWDITELRFGFCLLGGFCISVIFGFIFMGRIF